jgi:hypothetical protein
MNLNSVTWRKSSRCASSSCVEVAKVGEDYLVRDSKNPQMTPLAFTPAEWDAFVKGVKADEFSF